MISKPYCLAYKRGHWEEEFFSTENEMEGYYNIWFYDEPSIEVHFFKDDIEYTPAWVE